MSTYYCHSCSRLMGLIAPADASAIDATGYLLEKFLKHTAPTGTYPVNSVFDNPEWQKYKDFAVLTAASGCLEIDDGNRKNLIYFAGERTGLRFVDGKFSATCSGVKLVCGEAATRMHSFPSDFQPDSRLCANCGTLVPFDPR